jgi:hypothetical protein
MDAKGINKPISDVCDKNPNNTFPTEEAIEAMSFDTK